MSFKGTGDPIGFGSWKERITVDVEAQRIRRCQNRYEFRILSGRLTDGTRVSGRLLQRKMVFERETPMAGLKES